MSNRELGTYRAQFCHNSVKCLSTMLLPLYRWGNWGILNHRVRSKGLGCRQVSVKMGFYHLNNSWALGHEMRCMILGGWWAHGKPLYWQFLIEGGLTSNFRLYHGAKALCIQQKLYFEFSILIFSWGSNMRYDILCIRWAAQPAAALSQLGDHEGKQSVLYWVLLPNRNIWWVQCIKCIFHLW
jgi:hypothetical protein